MKSKKQVPGGDIQAAVEQLEQRDKVGLLGKGLGVGAGAAGGAAAAGSIATAAGATTLLGSTSLASVLGGVFVTTTPVGWVVGCALAAGLAGFGISKLIYSGGKHDQIRGDTVSRLRERGKSSYSTSTTPAAIDFLRSTLALTVERGRISEDQSNRMLSVVISGAMSVEAAQARLKALLS